MPDVSQYTFTHKEIVELLVKKTGVTDGKWQLMINFGFSAGNVGADDKTLHPSGIVSVVNVGIQKVSEQSDSGSLNNLTVDAKDVE